MPEKSIRTPHVQSSTKILLLQGKWHGDLATIVQPSSDYVRGSLVRQDYCLTEHWLTNDLEDLIKVIRTVGPDCIFMSMYGSFVEAGRLQGLFDMLNARYTHSDALSHAMAMNKVFTKQIVQQCGIRSPDYRIVPWEELKSNHPFPFAYIAKPIDESSSVSVHKVNPDLEPPLGDRLAQWTYGSDLRGVLVEKFIPGIELSAPVLNGKSLGVIEMQLGDGFFDEKSKHSKGNIKYKYPANVPENVVCQAGEWAENAHLAMGCSGATRSDLRYDQELDELHFLEINTMPSLAEHAPFMTTAREAGTKCIDEVVYQLIEDAISR